MDAIIEGNKNYFKKTEIKRNRLDACSTCPLRIDAPIRALKFKDDNEIINGKVCKKCLCPLPSLLRQDIKICENWKE